MIALSPAKVTERLGLNTMKDRSWYVHPRYVICRSIMGQCIVDVMGIFPAAQPQGKACSKASSGSVRTSRAHDSQTRLADCGEQQLGQSPYSRYTRQSSISLLHFPFFQSCLPSDDYTIHGVYPRHILPAFMRSVCVTSICMMDYVMLWPYEDSFRFTSSACAGGGRRSNEFRMGGTGMRLFDA